MGEQILGYVLGWNPGQRHGFVTVRVARGNVQVPIATPAEFAAIAAVLRESPVYLFPDGLIATGWEPAVDPSV